MVQKINGCVGCPMEIGCMVKCSQKNQIEIHCDECNEICNINYQLNEKDFCMDCAKEYLQEIFDNLTISEKAELFNINLKIIN